MTDDSNMTSGGEKSRHKEHGKDLKEKGVNEIDSTLSEIEKRASAEKEADRAFIKLDKLIEREENRLAGADIFLARLYRSIAYTRGIDGSSVGMIRWKNLLNQYIARRERLYRRWKHRFAAEGEEIITPNKNSTRGNMQKQLLFKKMSWYIFLRALRFLQIPRVDISIRVYTADGRSTLHEDTIIFNENEVEAHILSGEFSADPDTKNSEVDGDDDRHEE